MMRQTYFISLQQHVVRYLDEMIEVTMFDVQVPPRQLWITPCWSCWRCCSARGRACPPPAPTRRTSPCWSPPARQRHYITKAGKEPSRSFHDHISYSIMNQPASEGRSVCGVDSAGYSSRLRTWTNNIAFIYPRSSSKGTWLRTSLRKNTNIYALVLNIFTLRECATRRGTAAEAGGEVGGVTSWRPAWDTGGYLQ